MITQSEEGKRAEKWLTDAFRGEFSEFHIISLANEFTKHAAEARAEQREACAENATSKIHSPFLQKVQSKSGKLAEDWLKKLFAKGLFNEQYTNELFGAHIIELANIINSHAAEARAEQREKVSAWMIHNGYSTGHGDTIEELLDELKDQVKKSPPQGRDNTEYPQRNYGTQRTMNISTLDAKNPRLLE